MATQRHISGFAEAEKLLKQLPRNVENRVLQAATMAGAREMRKAVKSNAPIGTEEQSPSSKRYKRLSQNIKVQALKSARQKGRRGARVFTGNAFWGMFLEFGTRFISARPWFRPAIVQSEGPAVAKLKNALGKGIEREAKKLFRG